MSPAGLLNQYSYVIWGLALWLMLAFVVWRARAGRRGAVAVVAAGLTLVLIWLGLRSGEGGALEAAQVEAALGRGRPVLIEYYSDY